MPFVFKSISVLTNLVLVSLNLFNSLYFADCLIIPLLLFFFFFKQRSGFISYHTSMLSFQWGVLRKDM